MSKFTTRETRQIASELSLGLTTLVDRAVQTKPSQDEVWDLLDPVISQLELLLGHAAERPKTTTLSEALRAALEGIPAELLSPADLKSHRPGERLSQLLAAQASLRDLIIALILRLDLLQENQK